MLKPSYLRQLAIGTVDEIARAVALDLALEYERQADAIGGGEALYDGETAAQRWAVTTTEFGGRGGK